ncbi:MAG: GNAT family N-acetyltransferase [Thermoleophilia bacterium]|nr:GNAT family N-acetyltransferase [Thermoleophilia bacterium]
MREVRAAGLEALALATQLLRRARLADPEAGLWEAADLQWWWRSPRRSDELEQVFWLDEEGPGAGVVLTEWSRAWGCDPLVVPGVSPAEIWPHALARIEELGLEHVETLARDDDHELRGLLAGSGFVAEDDSGGITWLEAERRPEVVPPPDGFRIVDRTETGDEPHPMRRRNGAQVEARLRQTPLYEPGLDLAVEAQDGDVAGYALFWLDPVTEVGLVEPMRVEDAYQRRGLARALLTEGIERLARRGARRLKVGYGTEAARALYTGAGFRVAVTDRTYRLTAA